MEGEEANTSSHSTWETVDDEELLNSDTAILQPMLGDIWDQVVEQVLKGSSEDAEIFSNASPFFRNKVLAQRTLFLFEKVLPLVAISAWEKAGLQGFPVSVVLRCRRVCKHWCKTVDKVVPQKFAVNGASFFGKGSEDPNIEQIGYTFCRIQNTRFRIDLDDLNEALDILPDQNPVDGFHQHFLQTHHPTNASTTRNPFIWGNTSLLMYALLEPSREEGYGFPHFREEFTSLLSSYGSYIEHFELTLDRNNNFFFEDPSWFSEWLLRMPNIKHFYFRNCLDFKIDNCGELHLEDSPLPTLRLLETLAITTLPESIFNELIHQNNHITELFVGNKDYDVFTVPLPNLKSFTMFNCPRDIVQKLGSPQVTWPLEKLQLTSAVRLEGWAGLFEVIQQKFAETLVSLTLIMYEHDASKGPLGQVWQDSKQFRLELPKLKEIKIFFPRNTPPCLDFLLPMKKNLEEIFVEYSVVTEHLAQLELETSTAIIQVVGLEDKMLESNVWGIFEKLKKLKLENQNRYDHPAWCYFREDWMRMVNIGGA